MSLYRRFLNLFKDNLTWVGKSEDDLILEIIEEKYGKDKAEIVGKILRGE